jgi:hypothetical protein
VEGKTLAPETLQMTSKEMPLYQTAYRVLRAGSADPATMAALSAELASPNVRLLLALKEPLAFTLCALKLIEDGVNEAEYRRLWSQLTSRNTLLDVISTPGNCSVEAAQQIGAALGELDRLMEMKIARRLIELTSAKAGHVDELTALRLLSILECLRPSADTARELLHLRHAVSVRVRSKLAKIAGKLPVDRSWVRQFLEDRDARIRSNLLESLWDSRTPWALQVFEDSLQDPSHRVACTAAVGVHAWKPEEMSPFLLDWVRRPEPQWRAASAWAMGRTKDPRFREVLTETVRDSDVKVRAAALRAIAYQRKG